MKDGITHRLRRRAAGPGSGIRASWATLLTQGHGPLLLALFMIGSIVATGFALPRTEHLASLMVVVPATTAVLAGTWTTTLSAALSCVAAFVLDVHDNLLGTTIPAVHQLEILLVSAFVIASRSIRDRGVRELMEVRIVSDTIQRVLLRPLPPRIGPLLVRAAYHASHPYAQIGGDLYAVATSAAGVRFLIGDVKGKGLPAVEDAEALLGAFRGVARRSDSLPELVADLEHAVRDHFEESGRTDANAVERFITALVLEVPEDRAEIRMVSCGHPPPYMAHRSRTRLLSPAAPSPPLGLGSLHAEDYVVDTFPFGSGPTLLLYTDGAVEARNDDGQFYDLGAHVAAWPGSRPEELLQHVLDGLSVHVGAGAIKLDDDIAMIAVQYADGFPEAAGAASDERLLTS
ncbi:PP2C family protein-serine/threonine phosphatase [Streptomyces sp. ME03-5709C]|nr:PP2C family protein-serine/threonine phosphatase [Streptomyces sp. ME03-5709C]